MRFSLIVATLGRTEEIRNLLLSLASQTEQDFEVVVVDQNSDERLAPILASFAGQLRLRHLRSDVRNLSHAKNVGLRASKGDVVGFPDDDCIYHANTLEKVSGQFARDSKVTFVSGPAISPSGVLGSGRWAKVSGPVTASNVWTRVIAFNFFSRRAAVLSVGGYDEELGIGGRFGSGEESDLAIRLLRNGGTGHYDFGLRVTHPNKALTRPGVDRAYHYGTGMGRVLRKHGAKPFTVLTFAIRPLGGAVLNLLRLRTLAASYYWMTLRGRMAGYFADLPKAP